MVEHRIQNIIFLKQKQKTTKLRLMVKTFFHQPTNNDIKTYKNLIKTATVQEDDYKTGCLLDYRYFKENYKMIALYLNKQEDLDADPGASQQINSIANLDRAQNTKMLCIIEKAKETVLDFSQGTVIVL